MLLINILLVRQLKIDVIDIKGYDISYIQNNLKVYIVYQVQINCFENVYTMIILYTIKN